MKEEWKIVEKDGNPDTEGLYDVVLIVSEGKLAVRETRYFGDAAEYHGWIMDDQPEEGLVWTEETGSYPGERVYAWLPAREYPDIELPEGVEWDA